MSHGRSDQDYIDNVHNLSRFCLEQRAIAWLALSLIKGVLHRERKPEPRIRA